MEVFPYKYWKVGYKPLAEEYGVHHRWVNCVMKYIVSALQVIIMQLVWTFVYRCKARVLCHLLIICCTFFLSGSVCSVTGVEISQKRRHYNDTCNDEEIYWIRYFENFIKNY